MTAAYVIVAVVTILANASIAAADAVRARFVLANSAEVGVPSSWIPTLAILKAAGAAGILTGVLWTPAIGVAAAAGLTLFFAGALIAHIRASVYHNIAFPAAFLSLAVATMTLALTS